MLVHLVVMDSELVADAGQLLELSVQEFEKVIIVVRGLLEQFVRSDMFLLGMVERPQSWPPSRTSWTSRPTARRHTRTPGTTRPLVLRAVGVPGTRHTPQPSGRSVSSRA